MRYWWLMAIFLGGGGVVVAVFVTVMVMKRSSNVQYHAVPASANGMVLRPVIPATITAPQRQQILVSPI